MQSGKDISGTAESRLPQADWHCRLPIASATDIDDWLRGRR
jgi:hypothetical protein